MQHSEPASSKPPLHKFPICDSSKIDDWSAATLSVFGPSQVEPRRGSKEFRALFNLCPLQRTALCYGSFGGAFSVSVPESVSFVQGLPIRGVGDPIFAAQGRRGSARGSRPFLPGRPRNLCRLHEAGRASQHLVRTH